MYMYMNIPVASLVPPLTTLQVWLQPLYLYACRKCLILEGQLKYLRREPIILQFLLCYRLSQLQQERYNIIVNIILFIIILNFFTCIVVIIIAVTIHYSHRQETQCGLYCRISMLCGIFSYAIMQIYRNRTIKKFNRKINTRITYIAQQGGQPRHAPHACGHIARMIDLLVSTQSDWLNGTTV